MNLKFIDFAVPGIIRTLGVRAAEPVDGCMNQLFLTMIGLACSRSTLVFKPLHEAAARFWPFRVANTSSQLLFLGAQGT